MKRLVLLTLGLLFAIQVAGVAAPSAQGASARILKEENATHDISPTGWTQGKKTGWNGADLPPGLAKK